MSAPVKTIAPEHEQAVRHMFSLIPFNQLLELKIDDITHEYLSLHIDMRQELVGNFIHGILHGGVIATILDVAGGAMALLNTLERTHKMPQLERCTQLANLGTIDLRIDYLRPGRGERFIAKAFPLRSGNKIAVVRMELHNEKDVLIAVGTGTYLCG